MSDRPLRLDGRVALISGAASGIGRASALLFASEGARVVLVDVDSSKGESACSEVRGAGGEALFVCCDVSRKEDCARAVDRSVAEYGRLDILFNNAGIVRRATTVDLREEDWDRSIDVNLKGVFLMSKAAIPHLVSSGGGAIVNTGSGWGLTGGPRAVSYCASKGGVVVMTKAMALDHGPQNIRVNCLCPGDTDTPLLRGEAEQLGQNPEEFLAEAKEHRPLGRIGTPEDVARAALYLASDDSSFVTGTVLVVDGGGLAGG
jgi:NAD(P)-dependent dehydrogenase (short-subunit alcohol dehydrogenase family)